MTKLKRVFCTNCKKTIYRSRGRINENLKFRHNFYCSGKCESQYKSKKQLLVCENCGRSFMRSPKDISFHNYCSSSCAAKVNNKKYPKRKCTELKTCIKCGKHFRKSKGNLKYCSMKCRVEFEQKYTLKQILSIIKHAAQELKRVPAKRELKEIANICPKLFGSWNNAIIAAGLRPNRSHSQRMYKRVKAVAADGHFCDSISESLIDDWFTKNNISHEKDVSYPETNYKADWAISLGGHKVFIEYFGLANDSPRYDRTVLRKKELCQKYKYKLIEIYPDDIYPQMRLNDKLRNMRKCLENI